MNCRSTCTKQGSRSRMGVRWLWIFALLATHATIDAQASLAPQSITFAQPSDRPVGAAAFLVSATASSQLVVVVTTRSPTICTVAGKAVQPIAVGTCTLRASQAGNATYAAAPNVDRHFRVIKASQSITFTLARGATYGAAPITLSATASSKLAVTFKTKSPAICTVSGTTLSIIATGNCLVQANQAGNSTFNAAPPITATLLVQKARQTITFALPATVTYGAAPIGMTSAASSGLVVALTSLTPTICTVGGTTLRVIGAGICVVRAMQPGNANYVAAPVVSRTLKVAKASQTIAFHALAAYTLGTAPFSPGATATSGLPVTITTTTASACSVAANKVTLRAAGTCTLRATQAGSSNFNAASPVVQSFAIVAIDKAGQVIAFAPLPPRLASDPPFTITATASSQLPVRFSSATASVCTVSGATVTLLRAGECQIDANQPGDDNFSAAPTISRIFSVGGGTTNVISFDAIGQHSLSESTVAAHGTASSGLPVAFASTTPSICTVAATQIALLARGSCTIRATQPGNSVYPAAQPVERMFAVVATAQAITFPAIPDSALSTHATVATASANSGLPVHYASLTPAVCTTDGSTLIAFAAIGTCLLRASQAGDARFAPAADVERSFNVLGGPSNVHFDPIGAQTVAASPIALSAWSNGGYTIIFSAAPAAVCTVSGASLSLVAPGICNVSASESADGVHPSGAAATQSFVVLRTPSFMPVNTLAVGPSPELILPGHFRNSPNVDLVVPWQNSISILAGAGNGSFAQANSSTVGVFPLFGAVADFNNDGRLDFAISYIGSQRVGVEIGDGNDAFAHPFGWITVPAPAGLAATDLDGDGNPDLAVANASSGGVTGQSMTLLFGRGDGSFLPGLQIPTCVGPRHLLAADFDNDAIPDLAVTCEGDAIAVILRRGDGRFDFPPQIEGVPFPYHLAAADFNGDGNIDIVAASLYSVSVVLLGDGTGHFRKSGELHGVGSGDIAIADFNVDGTADIAVSNATEGGITLLAGVGDGSFATAIWLDSGNYPAGLATADVDGNGSVDLMYANVQDGTISVLRNATPVGAMADAIADGPATQAAPIGAAFAATLAVRVTDAGGEPVAGAAVRFELPASGASATFGNGARTIDVTSDATGVAHTPALRAGRLGGTFNASARAGTFVVDFTLTNQVDGTPPVFSSRLPPSGELGTPYSYALVASGSPAPRFSLLSGTLPPGLLLTPAGLISGLPVAGGTYTGAFGASNGNAPDARQDFSITIGTPSQSITFDAIADQSIDMHAVNAMATASSGLAVVLQSLTPQTCITGGNAVQLLRTGPCKVRASQPGNSRYSAAAPVDRSFSITQGSQRVEMKLPDDPRLFAPPALVDAHASSGLPVTLTSKTPLVCVIVDNAHVNFLARGTCTLQGSQAGNENYAAAQAIASVAVRGAAQSIYFQQPQNGLFADYTYLLATASSGLPVTLESRSPGVCNIYFGNVIGIGNDPSAPGNDCVVMASQPGDDVYDPALAVIVTFPFGFDPNFPELPPPTPHIVYATYLGGLGRDIAFDIVAAPDGGAYVGGIVGTTNFPKLSSQQFSNAGLDMIFVSKLQSQAGNVDYSAAVGAALPNRATAVAVPAIAARQSMTISPSGDVIVAAYAGAADFPQQAGAYLRNGSLGLFKVDGTGRVRTIIQSLDPAIQTVRAIACDKAGAIYATGVANAGLVTTPGAAVGSAAVTASAPYLVKISPSGSQAFATYLTVPNSRSAGLHDSGQGKNDVATTSHAIAVDDLGNAYVAGQATAVDFPATTGALDTADTHNRDAFVVKVNATGTAIAFAARIGFGDVDRATAIALEPDGSIVVAGKTASVDDFDGNYAFQNRVHFSQNHIQTLRVDREFGFVAQIDPAATRVNFMAAIGSSGGDLIDHAFEPDPRPLKIAVDPAGFIYATSTGSSDRTLPLVGLIPGVREEGVFLMKISPNGGQRYSTFLGEGVATGVATDGFGNAFVTGYARGEMPTSGAAQADCAMDVNANCITPFVVKVNDAERPVSLATPSPTIESGTPIMLTASVGDLGATGTIDISENGRVLATAPLVTGKAAFTLPSPGVGFHHYVATFHGSGYANAMSSPDLVEVIVQKSAP